MSTPQLTPDEILSRLKNLSGWEILNGKLHKSYRFPDFVAAWGFMSRVALVAESMGHHPEWFNVYNRVTVDLTTHDAGGISILDFTLAQKMDELAS
ncbi:4a-hydroxytetrahydrobiopterin dehydratase [Anthocerotibacter panamensis]|uniref:4a-hydroxytetrahydrobiopterin dehydratase n=1 Tax=Anthocerotibacter panamensis TaxID=2857077 RepID=UPI001C405EE1|nr:4a-hydroxytetrahydrobiopterin dehydratase [Anthocerotibacter panamensis]